MSNKLPKKLSTIHDSEVEDDATNSDSDEYYESDGGVEDDENDDGFYGGEPTNEEIDIVENNDENDKEVDNDDEQDDGEPDDDEVEEGVDETAKLVVKSENDIFNDDDESDNEYQENDEPDEFYLQKFNSEMNNNYIKDFHPECTMNNYSEIMQLTKVVRDNKNNIIDDLHKTIPYLTKYERAKILGQRAKQINNGATPFVKVEEGVIDGYLIAEMELMQKRIPFIIRRPIPGNKCEYWNIKDLENIMF